MSNPFRCFNSSPEVIRLVVMTHLRYSLSHRNVEDLLAERGIDISHETVRFCRNRFGPMFASEIRKRVADMRGFTQWIRFFVKINGKLFYLSRAVDHEGEILESVVTARRDKAEAIKLRKRVMKKHGRPRSIVTGGLRSYPAAMEEIGNADRQEVGAGSTIAGRTRLSRFDDANGPCIGLEARRRCKSSAQFMTRSTIILIRSVISSSVKPTNKDGTSC
jgi:putative transposase